MTSPAGAVTRLLQRIQAGEPDARDDLFELVYGELHATARRLMRFERPDHTLQPTALVNETFLRLDKEKVLDQRANRAFFFGAAVRAMHQILVDRARKRRALKRGGEFQRIPLDDFVDAFEETEHVDILDLDDKLSQLETLHPKQHRMIMLRYYGGLTGREIAELTEVSEKTVDQYLRAAKAWLYAQLRGGD